MATIDILILIIVSIGLLKGWRSGFLKQATGLLGTILALILAASFVESAGRLVASTGHISPEKAILIGFMGLFIVVKVAVNLVGAALSSLLESVNLSSLDRIVGGITGAAKAAIALSLIFVIIGYAQLPGEITRQRSLLYGPVYQIVPGAWSLFENRSSTFGDMLRGAEERLEQGAGKLPI